MTSRRKIRRKNPATGTGRPAPRHALPDPDELRHDLSDPTRLQHAMDHLTEMLRTEPGLQALRFPSEKLMAALDDMAETSTEELQAMPDPLAQRIAIVTRAAGPLITRKFAGQVETALTALLERSKKKPRDFRAAGAGLYFLEIHNRQGGEPGANPLWNIIFDLTYEEAMASAGDAVSAAHRPADSNAMTGTGSTFGDFFPMEDQDLTEDDETTLSDALELIESGAVELGFSLDTIILGLKTFCRPDMTEIHRIVPALVDTFRREIGMHAWHDMIWGLEYAAGKLDGDRKKHYETVLEAVRRFPARDNPAVFALYFRSVTDFNRFIKSDEAACAEAITGHPDALEPVLDYGRFLLTGEAPKRALNVFMAAAAIDPSDETARFGAGVACWLTGSCREARLHWDRAARLWRGYLPETHANVRLAQELAELDDVAELPSKAYNFLFSGADISSEE